MRFAAELGYHLTMVKDPTASYSDREMHAALEVDLPNYASAIVTAAEAVDAILYRVGRVLGGEGTKSQAGLSPVPAM